MPEDGGVQSATARVFTVTSAANGGPGSLREAIELANAGGGRVRIAFAIGSGPATVHLDAPLPPIAFAGVVDGWSQPGYTDRPMVEIRGADATVGSGLEIVGGGLTARGLAVTGWPEDGILVHDCDDVVLQGLHLGMALDGATAVGNGGSGVHALRAQRCSVGGTDTRAAVVASGNGGYGILFEDGADGGRIEGCFVGTDRHGLVAAPNQLSGVRVIQARSSVVGGASPASRNVLSGNVQYGLEVVGPEARDALVIGNHIGTDAGGETAVPNSRTGILVYSTSNVRIGGPAAGEGNVVSGNDRAGITVDGAYSDLPEYPYSGLGHCHDNVVQGNLIGVDRTGALPLGNKLRGILVNYAQDNTVIDNVIGANSGDGVLILGPDDDSDPHLVPTRNRVLRNRIGATASGASCGNGRHGVFVRHGSKNQIGGDSADDANIISGNSGRGVMFSGLGARTNVLSPRNDLAGNGQGEFHQPRG
jgi:hypothetical protein